MALLEQAGELKVEGDVLRANVRFAKLGEQLFLSVRTVESHRAHIQQKLRRSTRAELVRYALDRGLLQDG